MTQELVYSLLRKALTALGTILVQRGWVGEDAMLELAAGLAVLLGSVLWSWYQRRVDARQLKVAISVSPGTPVDVVKRIAAGPTNAPFGPAVLLVLVLPTMSACAAKSAPVLVAKASLGIAQTIGQIQTAAIDLHKAEVIDTRTAIRVQDRLLSINRQIEKVVPYLEAIERLQKSGVKPTRSELDSLITQVYLTLQELTLVGADMPLAEETRAFLALIRTAQQTMTTTMIELARVRVAIEG